jgi:hypothetical protein
MPNANLEAMTRQYFEAYEDKDRAAIEAVVGEDFHFYQPAR